MDDFSSFIGFSLNVFKISQKKSGFVILTITDTVALILFNILNPNPNSCTQLLESKKGGGPRKGQGRQETLHFQALSVICTFPRLAHHLSLSSPVMYIDFLLETVAWRLLILI